MKILLLDTAFAAAPIYQGLIDSGHDVWVMGNRANDLLATVAGDRWIDLNYGDVKKVEERVLRLGIERVVPGCTDISIETCLQLDPGKDLHDDKETYAILGNKAQFRSLCHALELPSPQAVDPESFPRPGAFVCKPVDSFSGNGVTIFDGRDPAALAEALGAARSASRSREFLIETHAEGQLYSYSGFLENGKFTEAFLVKEGSSVNPFAVDTSFVVSDIPRQHVDRLRTSLERLARHLDLKNGLLHTQFILSEEGPSIIEIARRCPGDLYPLLIEYSTGFEFASKYASYFCGYDLKTGVKFSRHVLRHTVTAGEPTRFGGLAFGCATPVVSFYPLTAMGETLLENQKTRVGLLFTVHSSIGELEAMYKKIMARESYNLSGGFGGNGW